VGALLRQELRARGLGAGLRLELRVARERPALGLAVLRRLPLGARRQLPRARGRHLGLVRGTRLLVGPALGLVVGRDRGRDARGDRRLPGLQPRTRAAGRGRDAGARGDQPQVVGIGQPFDRRQRERLLLEVLGERHERRPVVDPGERREPCLRVGRLAHDAREQLRVGEAADRRLAHGRVRGALRDARELPRVLEPRGRRAGPGLVRLAERHVHEARSGLLPHRGVGVAARELHQHVELREPLDGRAPDARIRVLACERHDDLVVRGRQPQHRVRANRGVRVLPVGSAAKPVDEGLEGRLRHGCLRPPDYTSTCE